MDYLKQTVKFAREKWFGGACLLTEFKDQLTTFMEGKLQMQRNIKSLFVRARSIENGTGQVFFLDAPGGTGKTFLLKLLLARVRKNGGIALAVASSGIAATLLDGGKTAHSAFKLPLNLMRVETPLCNISKQSNMAQVLKETKLIVWDECTMAHKGGVEALSKTLRDIRENGSLMGGVTVLLAGDFRQTLPVVPRGTRADEVRSCLKSSYLWPQIKKLALKTNMRVLLGGDATVGEFAQTVLQIGDGNYPTVDGKIIIPPTLATVVESLTELTNKIYPDIINLKAKPIDWLCERAILTPKNDRAAGINDLLLKSFEGEEIQYKSVDSVVQTDDAINYPVEFLNTLNPAGLPPHNLTLKIGAPVMLLRNLNPAKLCNGTRLQITALHQNIVEATIITGCAQGEKFPLKVCFAITINKAQGQTLKMAGIDLMEDCFSHGQFYVACSRMQVDLQKQNLQFAEEENSYNYCCVKAIKPKLQIILVITG
ncbi:ATP-dependent DNA helicase pif1-like [Zophobas morio]|uniref:ATP-dependent DNA helicase pif1-like n=1 Tax=Zophobas morio TaxID=2755281 RepID=UPI003083E18C